MELMKSLAGRGMGFALVGLLIGATIAAHAVTMEFGDASAEFNDVVYDAETGYVLIPIEVTNNDWGSVYVAATINSTRGDDAVITSGFKGLRDFSGHTLISRMISTRTNGQVSAYLRMNDNQDYVSAGWDIEFNSEGGVEVIRFGGQGVDSWVDEDHLENHTVGVYLAIGSWLYDGDGDPSNFTLDRDLAAPGDAIPRINPGAAISDAAEGRTASGTDYYAKGGYLDMEIIPKPFSFSITHDALAFDTQFGYAYQVSSSANLTADAWLSVTNLIAVTNGPAQLAIEFENDATFWKVERR